MNKWYEDRKSLSEAISFIHQLSCVYDWTVFASDRTPCYDYKREDVSISNELKQAIRVWYRALPKTERQKLNHELALLLGERYFVREEALVKIYSRILRHGDPRNNKAMIKKSLEIQIDQRMHLLKLLAM